MSPSPTCDFDAQQWQPNFTRKKKQPKFETQYYVVCQDRPPKIKSQPHNESKMPRTCHPEFTELKSRGIWPAAFSFRNLLLFNIWALRFSPGVRCRLNSMIRNFQQRIRDRKIEVWNLRLEIRGLRFEVSALNFEVSALSFEVWGLRFDVWGLRFEVSALRFEVWGLSSEVSG